MRLSHWRPEVLSVFLFNPHNNPQRSSFNCSLQLGKLPGHWRSLLCLERELSSVGQAMLAFLLLSSSRETLMAVNSAFTDIN